MGEAPREDEPRAELVVKAQTPNLGDLIVALLASTLAGLRDRLALDGFCDAADLVAILVDVTDDYLTRTDDLRRQNGHDDLRRRNAGWN